MDALLFVILAVAAGYLILRFRKSLSGRGGCGCGCGCGTGCGQGCDASCDQKQGGRNVRSEPFPMAPGSGREPGRHA